MLCINTLRNTPWLFVLLLLALVSFSYSFSQEQILNEEELLNELSATLDRQEKRIEMLEASLKKRQVQINTLKTLLTQSENAQKRTQEYLEAQEKTINVGSNLFKNYEKLSRKNVVSAGLIGATAGVVLGFIGGVVGVAYIHK